MSQGTRILSPRPGAAPARAEAVYPAAAGCDPSDAAQSPAASDGVARIVRGTFYLFIFSLLFELPQRRIPVEIPTLTGMLVLGVALLRPRRYFRWPPREIWCFIACLYVYMFSAILYGGPDVRQGLTLLLQIGQAILLFWLSYNMMSHQRIVRAALLTLIVACTVRAVIQLW